MVQRTWTHLTPPPSIRPIFLNQITNKNWFLIIHSLPSASIYAKMLQFINLFICCCSCIQSIGFIFKIDILVTKSGEKIIQMQILPIAVFLSGANIVFRVSKAFRTNKFSMENSFTFSIQNSIFKDKCETEMEHLIHKKAFVVKVYL